jgi:hypothetical protein
MPDQSVRFSSFSFVCDCVCDYLVVCAKCTGKLWILNLLLVIVKKNVLYRCIWHLRKPINILASPYGQLLFSFFVLLVLVNILASSCVQIKFVIWIF